MSEHQTRTPAEMDRAIRLLGIISTVALDINISASAEAAIEALQWAKGEDVPNLENLLNTTEAAIAAAEPLRIAKELAAQLARRGSAALNQETVTQEHPDENGEVKRESMNYNPHDELTP